MANSGQGSPSNNLKQSKQTRTERALRETEQRMRAIWETSVEGIITIDDRGLIESLNPAASRIFGYGPEEAIGQNVSLLMPSPDRERHDGYISNYLRTGNAKIIGIGREVAGRRKDGTIFPMDLSVSELRLGDRRMFTGFVRDLSERRKLEQAVAAAAEQERARIARELHDGLGQQLGGLLFMMRGLQRDLETSQASLIETAGQIASELATAIAQARELSHDLHAVPPEPDGLAQALENLADRVSKGGVICLFADESQALVHNPLAATHLYRIAQEAAHNAMKHARASRIDITLAARAENLELKVKDNGEGFPSGPISGGLGLHTMQQRAALIGGRLLARNSAEGGAEVVCSMPMTMLEKAGEAEEGR